jgi:hypothetical protein
MHHDVRLDVGFVSVPRVVLLAHGKLQWKKVRFRE